jgi:hypothetical protein
LAQSRNREGTLAGDFLVTGEVSGQIKVTIVTS